MAQRIAFLLPDLRGGGAERLTIDLAAGCLERGHDVDLVLLRERGAFLDLVPPGARIIDLAVDRLRSVFPPLRRYLKRVRPDGMVAAMWPLTVIAIAAARSLRRRPHMIVVEHGMLSRQYSGLRRSLAAMRATMHIGYRFADGVVGVSNGVAEDIARLAGLSRSHVTTISNPVGLPRRSSGDPSPWPPTAGKRILSVGTLKAVKNHRLLIEAFAALVEQQDATLAIVGEGHERAAIEAQVAAAGLAGKVLLPGFTLTPGDWYCSADLFVLASDNEGAPNVLVEALHHGLPVVATDCPSGPAEILGDGRWGRLVPPGDASALTGAMHAALADAGEPEPRIVRARAFGVNRAVDAYLDLLFAG